MRTATSKGGGEPAATIGWVGSLAHTPLAEVIRRIALEERSGDLQVTTASAIKTIYFDRGFVVFASSNLKSDRLGESMIEAGRISRREFAAASMLMVDGKRKFGQALVQAGIVSEEDLGHHVAAQVNRIILSLFSESQGMYSFDERPCIIPLELMVSLSVYRILIEGVRRMSSKKLILAALPQLDTRMRIVDSPPFTLNVDKLRPVEKAVLRVIRDGATLRDVVESVELKEALVLRACYGLFVAGVVETVAVDSRRRLRRVQEETGTFKLSEIRRKVGRRPVGPPSPPVTPVEPSPPVESWAPVETSPPAESAPPWQPPCAAETSTPVSPAEIELPEVELPEIELELAPDEAAERRVMPPPAAVQPVVEPGPTREEPRPVKSDTRHPVASPLDDREEAEREAYLRLAGKGFFQLVWEAMKGFVRTAVDYVLDLAGKLRGRTKVEPREPEVPASGDASVPAGGPSAHDRETKAAGSGVTKVHVSTTRDAGPRIPPAAELEVELEPAGPPTEGQGEDATAESYGVPSWSMVDDAASTAAEVSPTFDETEVETEESGPAVDRLGVPSWSMMDDPGDREQPPSGHDEQWPQEDEQAPSPHVEELGSPQWSIMDNTEDAREPSTISREEIVLEAHEREPESEDLGVPSWSILDDSSEKAKAPSAPVERHVVGKGPEVRDRLPRKERESEAESFALEPLEISLPDAPATVSPPSIAEDSDLFVEPESEGDYGASMLNHIPVEEIHFEVESPQEEIEFEIEEEAFQVTQETEGEETSAASFEDESDRGPVESELVEEETPEPVEAAPFIPPEHAPPSSFDEPTSPPSEPPPDSEEIESDMIPSLTEQAVGANRIKVGGGEQRLLRDVKLHFQFKDWEGAVNLLEQLVQISPGSAFYQGMLARAMSRHPVMRNQAEPHFIEALRLAPQDPQLHYWLGLYYKSFGLTSRAQNEFRTTLRIDPKHQGARKQLSGGTKRSDLGGVLKKLFG